MRIQSPGARKRIFELLGSRLMVPSSTCCLSSSVVSEVYTETWGNPTVAQPLPEPIIHDSSNTRTTRCKRRQTQLWLHRSIHTIKGSNPSTNKSATRSFWPMEHLSTGRRSWPTETDSSTRLLQCRLGYADHCFYQSVTGDPLFAQM